VGFSTASIDPSEMKDQQMQQEKMKRNKRTIYDRSQIDVAVESVLNNKLSLRAASHIYKIPFSTLRTRKICKIDSFL
jgi:hypothetical protein